jgi:hypothetical protein
VGPRAGPDIVERRNFLTLTGFKWRYISAEIVSVHSCNKFLSFYPAAAEIGTEN